MKVSDLIAQLERMPADAVIVIMDYRGNLDGASEIELKIGASYWPDTNHGKAPISGNVVEIS